MRRLLQSSLIVAAAIWPLMAASAQTTDLAAGIYVDQLTGFSVSWDPGVFTGEIPDVGGVALTGSESSGQIMTVTAETAADCVAERQRAVGLGEDGSNDALAEPAWPAGTAALTFPAASAEPTTALIACIPVGAPEIATFFLLFDIRGPGQTAAWEETVAAWQPVIDSLVLPDPATLTSVGISGNTYTDPLFGWSVQFDPARYEAQYGAGTTDSAFISGLFLYAEADMESGGIWAEEHNSVEDCLAAQRAVNEVFPGFGEYDKLDVSALVRDGMTAALYRFEVDESLIFLNFTACQPLLVGGAPVEQTWLVVSFSVPDYAFDTALAAWSELLDSLTFGSIVPGATPTR